MDGGSVEAVARYFDERADGWLEMERSTRSALQPAVAAMAGVGAGSRVLDLGCGLGVMVPTYLELGIAQATCVDVSERMIAQARIRWADAPQVEFLAADAAQLDLERAFDAVVIYNAYPHFMDRPALVGMCSRALVPGGRFVVAHSTGRAQINAHHDAVAAGVSLGLETAAEEAQAWKDAFTVDGIVDAPGFFAFCGFLPRGA